MRVFFDPVEQATFGWKLMGKAVEQQLRFAFALSRHALPKTDAAPLSDPKPATFSSGRQPKAAQTKVVQKQAQLDTLSPTPRKRAPSAPPPFPEQA